MRRSINLCLLYLTIIDSDNGDLDDEDDDHMSPMDVPTSLKEATDANYVVIRKDSVQKSSRIKSCANNAFDEWRTFRGCPTRTNTTDLLEEKDLVSLVALLV